MELLRLDDPSYVAPDPRFVVEDPPVSNEEEEALAANYHRVSDQLRALHEHPSGPPDA